MGGIGPMLEVSSLCKSYRGDMDEVVVAADDVTFDVPRGKMFTLLGPSGCGKTTTLRSIAGLEKPDSGEIRVDGDVVYSSGRQLYKPPNRRGFGMVFQSYAIWPHMTVFQNVAFPLQVIRPKRSRSTITEEVTRVLKVVALDELGSRPATMLSGGQQQRLALARAIVTRPPLLLLDEPLSNLDAKLRDRMRFELKRLQSELGLTTVYVTHDQGEALALSHRIAVMKDGAIQQIGSPYDIYKRPSNRFVAAFVGSTNFVDGRVLESSLGDTVELVLETPHGRLSVQATDAATCGKNVTVSIRPEHVHVYLERPSTAANLWEAVVGAQIFLGDYQEVLLNIGDSTIQARTHPSLTISEGDRVFLEIEPGDCVVCRDD